MRLMVGESSTTRMLFVLISSDTLQQTHSSWDCRSGGAQWQTGLGYFGGRLLYEKVKNSPTGYQYAGIKGDRYCGGARFKGHG